MAWDPSSLPSWDWETGSAILLQGSDGEGRKCLRFATSEGESAGLAGNEEAFYPVVSSIASSSASFHGAGAVRDLAPSCEHGRLSPFVAPAGAGAGGEGHFDWSHDEGNAHIAADQKSMCNNWRSVQESRQGNFLGLKSSEGAANVKEEGEMQKHDGKEKAAAKEQAGSAQQQGRLFLAADERSHGHQWPEEQQSSTATGSAVSGESLIGLHLGKRTYFQDPGAGNQQQAAGSKAGASRSAQKPAHRKPRAGASQTPRCQVEGCKADLTSSSKDYHRRHKVCEPHSKAGKVIVDSQEQRFCQQCSRFHLLAAFDEAKRSCRRRLAGHNERRRKPQPDALALSTRLSSSFQDWSFLHRARFPGLSSSWQDPANFQPIGAWPRMFKSEDQPTFDYSTLHAPGIERPLHLKSLSPAGSNDKLQLLLLQSPKTITSDDLSAQRAPQQYLPGGHMDCGGNLTLASPSSGAGVLSGLEATQLVTRVSDSGCALSLLSPHTRGSHAPNVVSRDLSGPTSVTLDQLINEHGAPQHHSLLSGQHYYDYSSEKMLPMVPSSHIPSTLMSNSSVPYSMVPTEKYHQRPHRHHHEALLAYGLNESGNMDSHSFLPALPGHHGLRGPEDSKPTIDLMRTSSSASPSATTPQGQQPMASQRGSGSSSAFGDLQYPYENPFFNSQQRI